MASKAEFRIGLDIGCNTIKMVSYHTKKDEGLSRLAMIDMIQEGNVNGPSDVNESHILNSIHKLLSDLPYKKASIRVCLSATMNNLFVITLPQVGEQELKQALFWELGPLLPDSVKNYEFDYKLLHNDQKKKQMTVLIGVFEKDRLDRIFKLFNGLGKGVEILDSDILSAMDLFLAENRELEESVGFLQLGAAHSSYVILSPESDPRFLFLPFGGNLLNHTLSKNMEISFSEAENHRRQIEIETSSLSGETPLFYNNDHIQKTFNTFTSTIIRFNIHHLHKTGQSLQKIYVTGGLLNDSFITQLLSQSTDLFQVPCEFWDPVGSHFPEDAMKPEYRYHLASALGLVLR